jgi:hypothetical protein
MAHALANRADKPAAEASTPPSSQEAKSPRTPGNALASATVVKAAEKVSGRVDLAATLTEATSATLAGTAVQEADRETAKKAGAARRFPEGPGDASDAQGAATAGVDLPKLHSDHAGKGYETIAPATPFVQAEGDGAAIDPHDVEQGELGDCYLIAGMAAVARAQPDAIGKLIEPREDGSFDVTLHVRKDRISKPTPVKTRVDAQLPSHGGGRLIYAGSSDKKDGARELWPSLIEKAFATVRSGYEAIEGGNVGDMPFTGATELLTGKNEAYTSVDGLSPDQILERLQAALDKKQPVTLDSRNMREDSESAKEANAINVYGNHAYAVEAVDLQKKTAKLQNPWGSHHVTEITGAQIKKFYAAIRVGGAP